MSILKGLKKIEDETLKSFHVPGHKNGRYLKYLPFASNLGYYDTTEIEGTDNLHAPEDIIRDTQRMIADFYGADESFLLVNGSTGGIISMIYAAFTPGDKVIISRDAHKSVFTGLILAQLEPIYVTPEIDSQSGVSLGVSPESIEATYKKHEDIKGLVITYPSYHGICTDLSAIEKIVHNTSGVLLVDAAHGAHLNLGSELPKTAIELGADIVIQSTHKSLPALTQSALMHYCSPKVSLAKLKMALAMFQSSSPSYLLMASVENAIRVARGEGKTLMENLLEKIRTFNNALEKETKFSILNERRLSKRREVDLTKITLLTQNTPYSGGALDTLLREKYSIQCEYGTDTAVLFITSIATLEEDLKALLSALKEISQEITSDEVDNKEDCINYKEVVSTFSFKSFELLQALRPSDAIHKERDLILLSDSIGEIAGDFIVPYPPGIPIIVPGEVISEQVVNYIEEGLRKGYNINGVFNCKTPQLNIIRR